MFVFVLCCCNFVRRIFDLLFQGNTAVYIISVTEPTATDSTKIAIDSNEKNTSAQAQDEDNHNIILKKVASEQKPNQKSKSQSLESSGSSKKESEPPNAWKKDVLERFVGTEEAESRLRCYNLVLKNMQLEKSLGSVFKKKSFLFFFNYFILFIADLSPDQINRIRSAVDPELIKYPVYSTEYLNSEPIDDHTSK